VYAGSRQSGVAGTLAGLPNKRWRFTGGGWADGGRRGGPGRPDPLGFRNRGPRAGHKAPLGGRGGRPGGQGVFFFLPWRKKGGARGSFFFLGKKKTQKPHRLILGTGPIQGWGGGKTRGGNQDWLAALWSGRAGDNLCNPRVGGPQFTRGAKRLGGLGVQLGKKNRMAGHSGGEKQSEKNRGHGGTWQEGGDFFFPTSEHYGWKQTKRKGPRCRTALPPNWPGEKFHGRDKKEKSRGTFNILRCAARGGGAFWTPGGRGPTIWEKERCDGKNETEAARRHGRLRNRRSWSRKGGRTRRRKIVSTRLERSSKGRTGLFDLMALKVPSPIQSGLRNEWGGKKGGSGKKGENENHVGSENCVEEKKGENFKGFWEEI